MFRLNLAFPGIFRLTKVILAVWITVVANGSIAQEDNATEDAISPLFNDNLSSKFGEVCAVCHGENLLGAAQGKPLVGVELTNGDSIASISDSIAKGFPGKNMPAFSETLSANQIKNLAIYISEQRLGYDYFDYKIHTALEIPRGNIESELFDFRLETVIDNLDPLPYSIAPLSDGRILLTEKMRGLSIISRDGEQSALIKGTPLAYGDSVGRPQGGRGFGMRLGLGWMLDVALHPEYEKNGWIYLQYGDRCSDCNAVSRNTGQPVSMNKLVRGRIKDGEWIDQETIWQADIEVYSPVPDVAAGGRITFDQRGHVFIGIGVKGIDHRKGVQDLSLPYGKIHRMYDDGRIPSDNPFTDVADAVKTTWTYGHRSPQGLEFNLQTGQLWGTEMGPRGGDEVNLLLPGKNYGWPLYSKGVNYDGTPVEYGKELGIEFDLKDIEQPVVDLTPSPAVSSFIFYRGDAFPKWKDNIIVGTLKATELYRMVLENDKVIHTEILLKDFARIRDIESGPHGAIYLLLEHASGGQIVRMVPGTR